MIEFLHVTNNWSGVESELASRGVKALTFYDVVFDFIFLDAFEDLDHPPASVTGVINNRWLTNSFKETVSEEMSNFI